MGIFQEHEARTSALDKRLGCKNGIRGIGTRFGDPQTRLAWALFKLHRADDSVNDCTRSNANGRAATMLDRMFSIGVMFTRTRTGDSVRTGRVGDQVDTGVAILRRRFLAMSAGVAGTVVLAACGSEEATRPGVEGRTGPGSKRESEG